MAAPGKAAPAATGKPSAPQIVVAVKASAPAPPRVIAGAQPGSGKAPAAAGGGGGAAGAAAGGVWASTTRRVGSGNGFWALESGAESGSESGSEGGAGEHRRPHGAGASSSAGGQPAAHAAPQGPPGGAWAAGRPHSAAAAAAAAAPAAAPATTANGSRHPAAAAPAQQPFDAQSDRIYAELVSMGFEGRAALDAARRCDTVEAAVNILLSQGDRQPEGDGDAGGASGGRGGDASEGAASANGGAGWQKVRERAFRTVAEPSTHLTAAATDSFALPVVISSDGLPRRSLLSGHIGTEQTSREEVRTQRGGFPPPRILI